MNESGFGEVWFYPRSVDVNAFMPIFKQRCYDMYIAEWRVCVRNSPSIMLFKNIKENFQMADYLKLMENHKHRHVITKIRLSSHCLEIERGRHRNIPRNDRLCTLCIQRTIEDEFHFILECPVYNNIRMQYIPNWYRTRPNMIKLIDLLSSTNVQLLYRLANYLIKAFEKRNTLLNGN